LSKLERGKIGSWEELTKQFTSNFNLHFPGRTDSPECLPIHRVITRAREHTTSTTTLRYQSQILPSKIISRPDSVYP
jgi:hypothetical protein